MSDSRILVVDDEVGMLEVCRDTLSHLTGVELTVEQKSATAAERIGAESWDLVVTDVRMPEPGGVALLRLARRLDPSLPVLMLTAYPSVETAVECMKLGAADYLTKPFRPEELLGTARRLLESRRLKDENLLLRRQLERPYASVAILGESPAIRSVVADVDRIAAMDVDVLIEGETGTGKELVARQIHSKSLRRGGRFVPVDCGAVPEGLLESEFFGHERGAFTGADARSIGLLEFASNGTFFLDEIGQLAASLQAKLLRALQERRIRRVGGKDEIAVDLRVVAATSTPLADLMARQAFRPDLYYRINVARLVLPPLREHRDDIPLLAAHFAGKFAGEMGRDPIRFDAEALEVLAAYDWPGNVRQLQNAVKRALVSSAGHAAIGADDLPEEVLDAKGRGVQAAGGFFEERERELVAFERHYLTDLLRKNKGDVTRAATEGQLPRGTFYRLLKKHGLTPSEHRG